MYLPLLDGTYDLSHTPTTMMRATRGGRRCHPMHQLRIPESVPFNSALVPRRDATGWELREVDEDGRLGEVIEVYVATKTPPIPAERWDEELTAA